MPRKKSIKKTALAFAEALHDIRLFLEETAPALSADRASWIYELAIVRVYREFERLVLHAIVGAINNDTSTISSTTGIPFPKHLTHEVCEFIVVGDGYFDFHGRDGLIKEIKRFVPQGHYLLTAIERRSYKQALERLVVLRNFAVHSSAISKRRAKETLGVARIGSAGSWLKAHGRMQSILSPMTDLSRELYAKAPF